MSNERFPEKGEHEEARNIFPVSRQAIDKAFPQGIAKAAIEQGLLKEAIEMRAFHPHLVEKLSQTSLDQYPRSRNTHLFKFTDGARVMYRILRHNNENLPKISEHALSLYDMENQRKMYDNQQDMKTFFANKWYENFADKKEHAELAYIIHKIGDNWTERREEFRGGAYYVARLFQEQDETQQLNKEFHNDIKDVRAIFPNLFPDKS